ncbi:MobQ family relaxase [uncultured Shewanella sp.]|uniref:MobQ family relaxase n=1 Tax=uncultured Shewanella sp. TaxID=173975 RepID=UPI002624DB13|nr:MobQ family relaxase [uncultured Shewanella sp.]
MAIYHCNVSVGSRSSGRSSTAACAYREGKKITDQRTGLTHDYSRKMDVMESLTLLPKNAPKSFNDSAILWNAVEAAEKRKDAQLFREVEVSLPREQSHAQNKQLILDYCNSQFVSQGMCATVAFHESKSENPHAHIMLSMREVNEEGFGKKCRQWNDRALLESWRENWAKEVNQHLEGNHIDARVDHRSLLAQGIEREATVHLGPVAHEMEKRGMPSERGDINRSIVMKERERQADPVQHIGAPEGMRQARAKFEEHKHKEKLKAQEIGTRKMMERQYSLLKAIVDKEQAEKQAKLAEQQTKEVQQEKTDAPKEQEELQLEKYKGLSL